MAKKKKTTKRKPKEVNFQLEEPTLVSSTGEFTKLIGFNIEFDKKGVHRFGKECLYFYFENTNGLNEKRWFALKKEDAIRFANLIKEMTE